MADDSPRYYSICYFRNNGSCYSWHWKSCGRNHGSVNGYSAGSRTSAEGKINTKAIEAMKMIGYDLNNHTSKSTDEISNVLLFGEDLGGVAFDYVITMGCGDECPFLPAKYREDWDIP